MDFDRLVYVVFSKVSNYFGNEIVGVGTNPLLILSNSNTDSSVGIVGEMFFDGANLMETADGGIHEVVDQYVKNFGIADYEKLTGRRVSPVYLTGLISAALDRDASDFEFENKHRVTILSDGELFDEARLKELEGLYGVWVMSRDAMNIEFDFSKRIFVANGDEFLDLGNLVSEILVGDSNQTVATLHI